MNLPASQLNEADRERGGGASPGSARGAAMKFTYPSGSRPLDGYTIKRGVGRGGFGEVYFATSDAGKEVALKLIRRNLEVELRGVTQCLNLKHPNLIGLFDIRGDELDNQWVIMEYVSGESLEDVIDRNRTGMPIDEVLFWMRGMSAGVAYLHDHGIVHRDLKPGNIFLDEGTVKIGDYGLAKFISCSRRSGQTESVGTVHYMAPEIANGRYGREIDTYALGIILYEMLTGTVPFEGESVGEVLMKHLTAEPNLTPLEEPYRAIVQRALTKDPDHRIKSVGEMLALLPGGGEIPVIAATSAAPKTDRDFVPLEPVDGNATSSEANANATSAIGETENVEEPIWKAIRQGFGKLRQIWDGEGREAMHPLAKALIVIALVAASPWYLGEAIAFGIPALVCYGVYYLIWISFVRPGIERRSGLAAKPVSDVVLASADPRSNVTQRWKPGAEVSRQSAAERYAERVRRRRQRPNWRDVANRDLAAKPLRDKLAELTGSMLMAALMAGLAALILSIVLAGGVSSQGMATHLWLALVGTLGSWAVLVPTKFAEGRVEDPMPMRLLMLILGGLVGVAAWALANALIVQLPMSGEPIGQIPPWGILSHEFLSWEKFQGGTNPPLAAYLAYFGFLFLIVRWWRQAEFTRSTRLSLWSVFVCVFWAWLLQFWWAFPQPAGMMVAGVTAFATQMSSPWLPPSRRRALSEQLDDIA